MFWHPARALQGDLVPDHQQHVVQSVSVVVGSAGDCAVSLLLNQFAEPVAHITKLFLATGLVYFFTSLVVLVVGKEGSPRNLRIKPTSIPEPVPGTGAQQPTVVHAKEWRVLSYLRSLPLWLWRVGAVFTFGFFTFFCIMPNASTWMGSSVLGGMSQFANERRCQSPRCLGW